MLQGDTFYDMVERSDVEVVKANMDIENNSSSGNAEDFDCLLIKSKGWFLEAF